MKYLKLGQYIILVFVLLFLSCKNRQKEVIDTAELISYFETDKIRVHTVSENKIEMTVDDSPPVENENSRKGYRFKDASSFGSVGALILSSKIIQPAIDTILVDVENNGKREHYTYNVEYLKQIRKFVDTSRKFAQLIGEENYSSAKKLLGSDVTRKTDSVALNNFITKVFVQKPIKGSGLIAFLINDDDNIASLYITVQKEKDSGQTYIFSYRLNGDGKIAGIRTP